MKLQDLSDRQCLSLSGTHRTVSAPRVEEPYTYGPLESPLPAGPSDQGCGVDRVFIGVDFDSGVCVLTRALLGLWIFHRLLGGRLNAPPPMISAPGRRRERQKAAFES